MSHITMIRKTAAAATTLWLGFSVNVALAADPFGQGALTKVGTSVYGGEAAARSNLTAIVGMLVKTSIGLLGIIFLILTVYAGYVWLMARGDEKQVTKAKDTLQRAVIGILIVISAYAISTFLFDRLTKAPASTPSAPSN